MAKETYNPKESEAKWQKFWETSKVFAFVKGSKKPIYSIDTPPPTVSGKMHIGHAFSYSQIDFVARYKRMKGFNLFFPFGTDDNGLPTQILVEKTKKCRGKNLGRQEFTKLCNETLDNELRAPFVQGWKDIGMSCDWSLFYSTIDDHSRKISQRSFIDLVKKGLAYRKKAPVIICSKCKTAIAQVECEDHERNTIFNHVKVEVEGGETVTFATTRPELMMACIAISVHPDDERYKHLIGKTAKIPGPGPTVPIIADDMTKMEFGSGVVYWCPYGDANDIEFVTKHPELEVKHIMNPDGRLNELAGKYEGMLSPEARKAVVADWDAEGAIVKKEQREQVINVHERCGTPIEYVAMKQWFIKVLGFKDKWLEYGNKLNWTPAHMKHRYDNWVNGLKWDWNISRQTFFGVPFPLWYCNDCDEPILASEDQLPVDPEGTNAPVDSCPKCSSKNIRPETDIMNTWGTSSLTPELAKELISDKDIQDKMSPMSMRPQSHDIITFWLFNTVVKSHHHHGRLPWIDTVVTGHVQDPKGRKMSKSKGNVIAPQNMIDKYSADALRFAAAGSKIGDDLPFHEKDLMTGQKTVRKLYNAANFVFMHLEGFDKSSKPKLHGLDNWLLSNLNKTIKVASEEFEKYNYTHPRLEAEKFFWQVLCDNYLELVKDRLYNRPEEKAGAQYALYHAFLAVLKLFAPIMPHITEELYQKYYKDSVGAESIHVADWPTTLDCKDSFQEIGNFAVEIVQAARKFKSENKVSLKTDVTASIKGPIDSGAMDSCTLADISSTVKSNDFKYEKGEKSFVFEIVPVE
jgi:valyl-tRNA synthetase